MLGDQQGPRLTSDRSPANPHERVPPAARIVALLEVLICSDYPTQIALASTFSAAGFPPKLSLDYVVTLSLLDTALLVVLIGVFLYAHGERPRDVLAGGRPIGPEIKAGQPMTLVALAIGIGVLVAVKLLAPSLHNVPHNPLEELIRGPRDALAFAVVVVVARAVREEIQRGFVLHRFDVWLGGGMVGVVVGSVAFGAGHLLQGIDAAIATGLLGAFWGVVYLRRRSVIAPMVSHSGFNLLEIAQYLAGGG